ncbi:MAG: SYNERG-CTERM sorting domain-containing protein, partial [Synergistaceae bacterium]|nr:SYNERG-CTERM sorting domain-containing protein [Synergistaceae bacterium]
EGDYDFYVILDPDNLLSEVHETWSHETPAGNNNGYHPFSVVNRATAAGTIAAAAVNEVSASDFELVFVDLEAENPSPMDAEAFRSYAMNHTEDFRAAGRIVYNGGDTLTNVRVDVMRDLEDGTRRHIANRHIPAIRPGKTRDFSFMVDHEKMAEGKLVIDLASDQGSFSTADTSGGTSSSNSSSGGCSAGFGGLTLLLALTLTLKRPSPAPSR